MISLLRVRVLFSLCACAFSLFSLSGFLARSLTHSGSHLASPIVHSLAPSDPRSLVPLQPHSVQPEKHSAWPEVPTTGELIRSLPRVPAAGTDWDQTKDAMVDETCSCLFPTPTVLPSPDIRQELSGQGPAAQLHVSGDLTKMIAVFAEDRLDIGDQEVSGVRSIDVHDQDFESCSGDEGSLGFDLPDELMGRIGCSRDHGGVELGAMNIGVMDLQDPQDKAPMAGFLRGSQRYNPDSPLRYRGN